MKIAAIDIGSNSIHMVIARVGRSGFEVLDRSKEMVGLARGTLETGELSPAAIEVGFRTLETFQKRAEKHGAERIVAVATSAVREARNGGEFALRVWDRLALPIDVITGTEEARLIFLAVASAMRFRSGRPMVVDVGGGSVEVIFGDGPHLRWSASLKLGVVRMTERFLRSDPPTAGEIAALEAHLDRTLAPVFRRTRRHRPTLVVGTSGTILNLTAMAASLHGAEPPASLHGRALRRRDLLAVRALVLNHPADERAKLRGLDRKRVDIVPAGAILVDRLFQGLGVGEIRACESALREGILLDFVARHADDVAAAEREPDLRRRSVFGLAARLKADEAHGRHVAALSLDVFDATKRIHGLDREDRELLEFAALLHDVGLYVSHSKHHKHSQYLITHGELRGFSPDEVRAIAAIARWHKGAPPKPSHEELRELDPDLRRRVIALTAILRIADSFDRSHHHVVRGIRTRARNGTVRFELDTAGRDAAMEMWGAERKADLFEKCFGVDVELAIRDPRSR